MRTASQAVERELTLLSSEYGSVEAILESGLLHHKKTITAPHDTEAYLAEVQAARAVFLSPLPVSHFSPDDFRMKAEDPALQDTLKNFGLDPDWEAKRHLEAGFASYGDAYPNDIASLAFDDEVLLRRY